MHPPNQLHTVEHNDLWDLFPLLFLQQNIMICETSSHSSSCLHILPIAQHSFLHQHYIYHALYFQSIFASSHPDVLNANSCAQSKYYKHKKSIPLLPLTFSPGTQNPSIMPTPTYLQPNHSDLLAHITYSHYLLYPQPIKSFQNLSLSVGLYTTTTTETLTLENLNLTYSIPELTHSKPITAHCANHHSSRQSRLPMPFQSPDTCNDTIHPTPWNLPISFQLCFIHAKQLKLSLSGNIYYFLSFCNPIYPPYIPCIQSIYTIDALLG